MTPSLKNILSSCMEVYILEDSHPTYVSRVIMDLPGLEIKKKVDKVSKWWLTGSCLWRCFVAENIGDTGLVEDTGKYILSGLVY